MGADQSLERAVLLVVGVYCETWLEPQIPSQVRLPPNVGLEAYLQEEGAVA